LLEFTNIHHQITHSYPKKNGEVPIIHSEKEKKGTFPGNE
jgi:hypothetical protein